MKRLVSVAILLFCMMGVAVSNLAAQEAYPNRPVTLTQAYAVGGGTDLLARAVALVAPKYFSQPIIVVAKPGGAGLVALQAMASAKPDGHHIHLGKMGDMVNNAFIEKMPFDMEKDFIPVCGGGDDELVVLVSSKAGFKTIEELIAAAKKDPGKYKSAVAGTTASGRLVFEAFTSMLGIDIPVVPFKGEAPALIATAGGHVPVTLSTTGGATPYVQRGDLVPLVMMGNRRVKELPNVPTTGEKGWKFDMTAWFGFFVAKGTPPAVVAKIENLIKQISADPDYIKAVTAIGSIPRFTPGKEFAEYLKNERKVMGALIKKLGISNIK